MTTPTPRPDDGYVPWLLQARTRADVRSDLRRGDLPAMADRAYRHLARFWRGQRWLRTPLLLHAALAAEHAQVPDAEDVGIGRLARSLVRTGVLGDDTVAARLLAVQRMDLPDAHRMLRPLLHAADATRGQRLSWRQTYELYRSWDHPDLDFRTNLRRRLLEQYHG